MARLFCAIVLSLAATASPALSAGAPQAALNKTVTMSWGTSGTGTSEEGRTVSFNNINTRTVYISSAGRTFLRMSVRGKRAERGAEKGPDDSGGRGSVKIDGNRLVGTEAFASGARQFVATFDPSFTSCTLSIIDAKAGNASIKRRGPDGAMYTLSSVSTGSTSCSVQSGNTIGGQ